LKNKVVCDVYAEEVATMAGTGSAPDSETPLSPGDALALVEAESRRVSQRLNVDVVAVLGIWGVTWLVGFGLAYFASVRNAAVPWWLAGTVIGILSLVALAVSFGQPIRRGRGIEGASRQVMAMYMWAWPLTFAALYALDLGLVHQGLPVRLTYLLWPGTSVVAVGVLYLGTGFLYRDLVPYGLGVWMLVTGASSVFAGHPGNFAVLSLAGGGGFLVAAVPYAWRRRRSLQ
jgi:hypothetical protein